MSTIHEASGGFRTFVEDFFVLLGRIAEFLGIALRGLFAPRTFIGEVLPLSLGLVARCAIPAIIMLFGLGVAISIQAGSVFRVFSAEPLLGGMTGLMIFREIGPVIAAVLIAAQGGTSTATELGAMRVKEEIDALELIAVDPMRFLVLPRILAFVIAAPILNFMACLAGMAGGYLAAIAQAILSSGVYTHSFYEQMTTLDIWNGTFKTSIFGLFIGTLSTFHGYHASGGAEGVGRAANRAVVQSIVVTLVSNYFITTFFFGAIST